MRKHSTSLLTLVTISSGLSLLGAPPNFQARHVVDLQNAVIALGDFNKDGRTDIVSVMLTPNTQTSDYEAVMEINSGNGTFQQGKTVDLGPNFIPSAAVTGDFNGDGFLDFAVYSAQQQALYVVFQFSKGFEIVPIEIPTVCCSSFGTLTVGDLNKDGKLDVVVSNNAGTWIVLNQGSARFAAPSLVNATFGYVSVADLNGDKNPDLVLSQFYCCGYPTVEVLLGDGHGLFTEASQNMSVPTSFGPIAVADFNGDGRADVATLTPFGSVSILLGDGTGSFSGSSIVSLPSPFSVPVGVTAGDLNGDGLPDLAVIASGSNNTSVFSLLNTGAASFTFSPPYAVQNAANAVQVASLNADLLPDLLVSNNASNEVVSLLLNTGGGAFQDGQLISMANAPTYMVSGDFNGDGMVDLVAVNAYNGLMPFLNNGTASLFTPAATLPFYTGPIAAGDFNSDGRTDLVIANQSTGQFLLGRGDGTFLYQPPTFSLGYTPGKMLVADMNNDGEPDLVTNAPAIALGKGNGRFQPAVVAPNYCYYPGPTLAVSDFNKDGKLDVLSACNGSLTLTLGNGDGTFQGSSYPAFNIESAAVGDFNRDGIPDIVFTSIPYFYPPISHEATILIGVGDGTFQTGQSVLVPTGLLGLLTVADFNGDGVVDIAVLDDTDSVVSILQGNGDGTFLHPVSFGAGTNPTCMVAGRFRPNAKKGEPDLAFCSAQGIAIDINITN